MTAMLAAAALAGLTASTAGCGGTKSSGNTGTQSVAAHAAITSPYKGSLASPPEPAPPLALRNYQGKPVNISQYRGKAVLVTFLYTHCPDACPLIASNLGVALHLLGPKASRVQAIAVSVDPKGDNPQDVRKFLTEHRVMGRMQYLLGSAHELAGVWKAWNVGSEKDTQNPELVNHTGLVYGVSASGKITTLYPSNFAPGEVAHDVPLLASS